LAAAAARVSLAATVRLRGPVDAVGVAPLDAVGVALATPLRAAGLRVLPARFVVLVFLLVSAILVISPSGALRTQNSVLRTNLLTHDSGERLFVPVPSYLVTPLG
jgi:hypothetical protein